MTSPLPIPVGTLCVVVAAERWPGMTGRLCTVLGQGERIHPESKRPVACYDIELDDPPKPGPWFCLPHAIKPLPPPPLSITILDETEAM